MTELLIGIDAYPNGEAEIISYEGLSEESIQAWSATKTYDFGEEVIYEHAIYGSLVQGNLGFPPTPYKSNPAWSIKSRTAPYNVFDKVMRNATISNHTFSYKLALNGSPMIALFNVSCAYVKVTFYNGKAVLEDRLILLSDYSYNDEYFDFFFGAYAQGGQTVLIDNIPISADTVKIVFQDYNYLYYEKPANKNDVYVGEILFVGKVYNFGDVLHDTATKVTIKSNSPLDIDRTYGTQSYTQLPSTKSAEFLVHNTYEYRRIMEPVFASLSGMKVIYSGHKNNEVLQGYGVLGDIQTSFDLPDDHLIPIRIDGLV